jgi:hypothetical protein
LHRASPEPIRSLELQLSAHRHERVIDDHEHVDPSLPVRRPQSDVDGLPGRESLSAHRAIPPVEGRTDGVPVPLHCTRLRGRDDSWLVDGLDNEVPVGHSITIANSDESRGWGEPRHGHGHFWRGRRPRDRDPHEGEAETGNCCPAHVPSLRRLRLQCQHTDTARVRRGSRSMRDVRWPSDSASALTGLLLATRSLPGRAVRCLQARGAARCLGPE